MPATSRSAGPSFLEARPLEPKGTSRTRVAPSARSGGGGAGGACSPASPGALRARASAAGAGRASMRTTRRGTGCPCSRSASTAPACTYAPCRAASSQACRSSPQLRRPSARSCAASCGPRCTTAAHDGASAASGVAAARSQMPRCDTGPSAARTADGRPALPAGTRPELHALRSSVGAGARPSSEPSDAAVTCTAPPSTRLARRISSQCRQTLKALHSGGGSHTWRRSVPAGASTSASAAAGPSAAGEAGVFFFVFPPMSAPVLTPGAARSGRPSGGGHFQRTTRATRESSLKSTASRI